MYYFRIHLEALRLKLHSSNAKEGLDLKLYRITGEHPRRRPCDKVMRAADSSELKSIRWTPNGFRVQGLGFKAQHTIQPGLPNIDN